MLRFMMVALALLCTVSPGLVIADDEEMVPAVKTLDVQPTRKAFDEARATKPIELTSEDTAKAYFSDEQLKTLSETIDWSKQRVLVFAWRGSGRDTHTSSVLKADGKRTVVFTYQRGLTRDLRSHTRVYAIDSSLAWRADRSSS